VTIGERNDAKVEVLSGIAPGDEVISSGIQKVRDGGAVQAMREAAGEGPRERGGSREDRGKQSGETQR
jgi:hypothetical protein